MSESLRELLDAPPVSNSAISLPKTHWKTKGRNLLDKDDEVVDVRKMMRLWIKPKCRVGRRKNGGYGVVDEGFGARGRTGLEGGEEVDDVEEGRKGDYDANFFADDEQLLPFDGRCRLMTTTRKWMVEARRAVIRRYRCEGDAESASAWC